jgi:PAS domain S-box-containing protein
MAGNSSENIPRLHWYSLGLPRNLQITVWISIILVFVIAFLDLTGWIFNITLFKSIMPHWTPMKIITAICFIFTATALVIIQVNLPETLRKILPRIFAAFVCLISLVTLYVYLYSKMTGQESSLTGVPYLGFFLLHPMRMAFIAACNFFLISCVLFVLPADKTKTSDIAHVIIIPVTFVSYFVTVSYILNVYSVNELKEISVAMNSGIAFLGICTAVLMMRPETWLLKVFTSGNTGGIIARKLLPALLTLPVIIGWLRINGERAGLFKSDEGVILVAITYTVCFVVLVWRTSRSVDQIDRKRRISEEALRESEDRFKAMAEGSPVGMGVVRIPDGNFLYVNPAYEQYFGYNKDELLSKKAPDIYWDTRDRESINKKLQKNNFVSNYEVKLKRKDGSSFMSLSSIRAIKFMNEPALLGTFIDITKRKEAEDALRNSELRLKYHFENSPLAVIEWDKDYFITQWSNEAERIFGWKKTEVIGKRIDDLNFVYEEDNPIVEKTMERLSGGNEPKVVSSNRNYTKKREIRDCIWYNSALLDEKGQLSSTMSLVEDITERKRAENKLKEAREKLNIALENGNIGIWEWNLKTDEVIWDERMEKMFGLEPGTFGKTFKAFAALLNEEDISHIQKSIGNALEKGSPVETIFRTKSINGKSKYISSKALVNRDKDQNPVSLTGVCFDVTAMREGAEQLVLKLNEELLRSNKELEQFAYVASHDLQEPLRMVSSFTQLLSMRYKDQLDQEAQEFIKFAVDGALRMQNLINDLLEYSRVQTRGKDLSVTDMHDILGQTVNNLSIKIQEKNALVTNDELPTVLADGGQMVQLFQNLIGNALKFCKTTPMVHISAKEEKDDYLFSVKDNGIGIEPQYFDRIFQIFQRLHPKDEYGGTGIGLAICRRIVERHGGKIWVESQPGEGTEFKFTIRKNK